MKNLRKLLILSALIFSLNASTKAYSQATEEQFHDLFITAGYSTAYGAALGAAFIALTENPSEKLSYIYVGASLGFIGGSLLGTYFIFSPMLTDGTTQTENTLLGTNQYSQHNLVIRPTYNIKNNKVVGIESAFTLARF